MEKDTMKKVKSNCSKNYTIQMIDHGLMCIVCKSSHELIKK